MELGIGVPLSGSWATPEAMVDVASAAERHGFVSLWTFQRLLSPVDEHDRPTLEPQYRRVHDPLATLAYLAGRTTTARLGVAVVNAPFYAPAVLAKLATTIDHLSGGRLVLGLGAGWAAEEFTAARASMEQRGAQVADVVTTLRALWADGVVEHQGRFGVVPRSLVEPKPVQRPSIPIVLGGTADAALRRAGRLADGWVSSSRADLSAIGRSIAVVRQAAADAGRHPGAVRIVCRGAVRLRRDARGPLTGSWDDIREDLASLAAQGVDETFLDLNFDPEVASPDVDPAASLARAHDMMAELAPGPAR